MQRKNKYRNKDLAKKRVSSEFQQGQFIHNYRKEVSVQLELHRSVEGRGETTVFFKKF